MPSLNVNWWINLLFATMVGAAGLSMTWNSAAIIALVIAALLFSDALYKKCQRENEAQKNLQACHERKMDLIEEALLAILHDRLYQACRYHLARGYINIEELSNLDYLYRAYASLGGNSTGTELYERCKKLPIRGGSNGQE